MFSNVKLSRNPSPPALDGKSSSSTGPGSSKGKSSSHDHPELAARGSPGETGGVASLAPRKTLNRLNALPSHAKASAPLALPEQHVRFAALAQVKVDDHAPRHTPVDFGPKNKPQRSRRSGATPSPSHSAAPARPAEQPKSPQQPAPSPVSTGPGPQARSPAQKFNDRLWDFMHNYPDMELKQKVTTHLVAGTFGQLKRDLAAAAARPELDRENVGRLQLMLSSLRQMNGNYENVRVLGLKPPR